MEYNDLISRNWAYINEILQSKIKRTKLFIAGCGLGSVIAELAVRTGFENFILADGDLVEISNLNRQVYSLDDLKKNKVQALKEKIISINPNSKIEIFENFISTTFEIKELINKADIIINTIDFDSKIFFSLNEIAVSKNKTVFFPLNIGFAGTLMIFSKNSISMKQLLEISKNINNENVYDAFIKFLSENISLSPMLKELYKKFENRKFGDWNFDPQLGIASFTTAAITITNIIKVLNNEEVPLAPQIIRVDLYGKDQ